MHSRKLLVALLMILAPAGALAQESADRAGPVAEPKACNKVSRVGEEKLRSFFMFSASGHDYTIRVDGRAESAFGKGRAHDLTLKTDGGRLDQVYFCEAENDLILLYELSDQENGWAYVMRLNQATVKPRWITPITATDLGPALLDGSDLYFTAASLAAKIDLKTGAYAWQQADLHARYAPSFATFQNLWLKGDHVFFKEDRPPYKSIELDKSTGKLINILE
jgi:hypothetical protein